MAIKRKKEKFGSPVYWLAMLFPFFLAHPTIAEDLPLDAGLILSLSGNVEYADAKKPELYKEAQALMKIREKDRLKIPEGGQALLLFQANGRKETWKGPVDLEIALTGGRPSGACKDHPEPRVEEVAVQVSDSVFSAPKLIMEAVKNRSGVSVVRGRNKGETLAAEYQEKLDQYAALKQQAGKEDPMPDLFLLATYAEFGKQAEMKTLINTLAQQYPNNAEIKTWRQQISP